MDFWIIKIFLSFQFPLILSENGGLILPFWNALYVYFKGLIGIFDNSVPRECNAYFCVCHFFMYRPYYIWQKKKQLTPFWGNIDCCPQSGHVMVKLSGGKYVPRQPKQKVWRQGRTWKEKYIKNTWLRIINLPFF